MTKQVEMTSKFCPCLPAIFKFCMNYKVPTAPEPDQSYWINTTQGSLSFGGLIMVNALLMGVETEFPEPKAVWTTLEVIFIIIFTGEIFARVRAEKWWYPFDTWNILDCIVVGVGYASLAVQGMESTEEGGEGGNTNHLQITLMIRVFRLLRLIRIIKVIRFFPELALLVGGVVNSMKTLGWVFVLIMLVSWVWAIVFTKMLGQREAVIAIAYAGSCRDDFVYTRALDPALGLNCEIDLDPEFCYQRAEVACEIIGWFGSVPASIISLIMTGTLEAYIAYARAAM
jgi:hypothetical protein